jgi:hypothetical protein
MPRVIKKPTGETTYYGMTELPGHVKKFIKELGNLDINNIDDITYEEFIPYPEFTDEDDMPINDVSIYINVDTEDAVKNKTYGFENILQNKADNIAKYFSIEDVYIFVHYINKEEFAKKFLKQLKLYLKTTKHGPSIHSVKYNSKEKRAPEITITKKREAWGTRNSDITDAIKKYLTQVGYPNIKINFSN